MTFYSQQGEDLFIYKNFINNTITDGVFVELGAYDGLKYSNTMFFQQHLGFKGILIEPIKELYDKLILNRLPCKCYNTAISLNEDDVQFYVNGAVSGIKENMTDCFIKKWHKRSSMREISTTKLDNIFERENITYIDFFSLDVEGGELDVLNTINWSAVSMYLMCIELDGHNKEKDKKCREILIKNGFEFKAKLCINEFWINPNYSRKDLLFDKAKKIPFTGNMDDYGKHIYIEKKCRTQIENGIIAYEKSL
jgi:FkbM family methyltransferase